MTSGRSADVQINRKPNREAVCSRCAGTGKACSTVRTTIGRDEGPFHVLPQGQIVRKWRGRHSLTRGSALGPPHAPVARRSDGVLRSRGSRARSLRMRVPNRFCSRRGHPHFRAQLPVLRCAGPATQIATCVEAIRRLCARSSKRLLRFRVHRVVRGKSPARVLSVAVRRTWRKGFQPARFALIGLILRPGA